MNYRIDVFFYPIEIKDFLLFLLSFPLEGVRGFSPMKGRRFDSHSSFVLCFPFDMWPLGNPSTSKVCPISAAIMAGKLQGFFGGDDTNLLKN